jgi:hypothetical protein
MAVRDGVPDGVLAADQGDVVPVFEDVLRVRDALPPSRLISAM